MQMRWQQERLGRFLKKPFREKVFAVRNRLFPWLPLPVRLSSGALWLARNDAMGRVIFLRTFEQEEQRLAGTLLEPGMTVFDLGAHHGLYTLLASKKVGASGRVVAFEPSPRELSRLRLHLRLNRCHNVRIEPVALGSQEGTAELFVPLGIHTGFNSLRPPKVKEPVRRVTVPMTTLDSYVRQQGIAGIDFIKMDVEGAELEVLKGGASLLGGERRPIVMCEMQDKRTEAFGYRAREIYQFLAGRGYRWFSVAAGGGLQSCSDKDVFSENLFAVPRERWDTALERRVGACTSR